MDRATDIAPANQEACVLVVEDDPALRKLLAITLGREQLPVTTAKDGGEAIEHLNREQYCVVLLDLMMPGMNGWSTIEWLKEHPMNRPRTVVVVTAFDRKVLEALDPAVVNAIIIKPFNTFELAGYVRGCCRMNAWQDRRSKRLVGQE